MLNRKGEEKTRDSFKKDKRIDNYGVQLSKVIGLPLGQCKRRCEAQELADSVEGKFIIKQNWFPFLLFRFLCLLLLWPKESLIYPFLVLLP